MSYDCNDVNFPTTLKQTLDFLSRLKELNASSKLANELKNRDGVRLFKEGGFTHDIETNIQQLLVNAHELRTKIVSTKETKQYGDYDNLDEPNNRDCIERYVNIFIGILPKLHGTLYYLYFNVNRDMINRGGGSWHSYLCNDTAKDLHKWLIKSQPTPSSNFSNVKLFPGGYNGLVLNSNQGTALFESLQQLVRKEAPGGYLQNILIYLIMYDFRFANDTASVLAFLVAFCDAVTIKVFHDQQAYEKLELKLEPVCKELSDLLSSFTSGDEKNSTYLVALYQGSFAKYGTLIDPKCFVEYVSWLKQKVDVLIGFMQDLSNDCKFWNSYSLKNSKYAGPFPYGFMFGSKWSHNDDWSSVGRQMSQTISKVIADLRRLTDCLKESEKAKPATLATGTAEGVDGTTQVSVGETGNTNAPSRLASTASNQQHSQQADYSTTESSGSSTSQSPETGDGSALTNLSSPEPHRNGNSGGLGREVSHGHGASLPQGGVTPRTAEAEVHAGSSYGSAGNFGPHYNQGGEQEKRGQAKTPYEGDNSTITIGGAAGGAALLGGGCAALYFLNVGGIKTLITGVP